MLPSHTTQSFYTSSKHPYEKYFCHLHVQSHGASFFEFIHTPLCVDAGDLSTAVNLFEKMIQYSGQTTISSLLKVKQYTLELLIYFLECCPSGSVTLVENSFDIPLKKALTYAEKRSLSICYCWYDGRSGRRTIRVISQSYSPKSWGLLLPNLSSVKKRIWPLNSFSIPTGRFLI